MLREGEIHPQLIVLAVARVAGGHDMEEVLRDSTVIVHQACSNYYEAVQAEAMLVAENA